MALPVDPFTPIGTTNRDEYILVSFWTLKNMLISVLRNIIDKAKDDPDIGKQFPGLITYAKLRDYDALYYTTALHACYESFFYLLTDGNRDEQKFMEFMEKYQKPYNFEKVASSMLEFALKRLATKDFVKEIVVIDPSLDMEKLEYISNFVFDQETSKVRIIEGNIATYAKNHPEITTVIMESSRIFWEIAEDTRYLQGRYFIIQSNYDDIMMDPDTGVVTYANIEAFNSFSEQSICAVSFMEPRCFSAQTPLGEQMDLHINENKEEKA